MEVTTETCYIRNIRKVLIGYKYEQEMCTTTSHDGSQYYEWVNKWSFKKPVGILVDNTFSSDEDNYSFRHPSH
jgi:hypothetical protein